MFYEEGMEIEGGMSGIISCCEVAKDLSNSMTTRKEVLFKL